MADDLRRDRDQRPGGLPGAVFDDFRRGGLGGRVREELGDLYRFYLDDRERRRLESAGALTRWARVAWVLFRNAMLRLPPTRRAILVAAGVLALASPSLRLGDVRLDVTVWPWVSLALFVVLMLELKDKLLARDEIEVARRVQLSLMPSAHPRIAGWRVWSSTTPANSVGGDLVDYVALPGGALGIALGDVAGKGMGAALLAAKLQATLRAIAPEGGALDVLGERLSGILHRDGLDNRFATLFYVEIAPASSRLRWLNAGHNAGLLVRNGTIEPIPASSYPLGLMAERAGYVEGARVLARGDVLVVYSDGLSEATNGSGEEWGEERLRLAVLGAGSTDPEEIGRAVLAAAEDFRGRERLRDDRSIVVLACEGAAGHVGGST